MIWYTSFTVFASSASFEHCWAALAFCFAIHSFANCWVATCFAISSSSDFGGDVAAAAPPQAAPQIQSRCALRQRPSAPPRRPSRSVRQKPWQLRIAMVFMPPKHFENFRKPFQDHPQKPNGLKSFLPALVSPRCCLVPCLRLTCSSCH